MRCNMEGRTYKIFGYKGKMVRDAIHSHDVVTAFEAFFRNPRSARSTTSAAGGTPTPRTWRRSRIAEKITGHEIGSPSTTRRTGSATTSGGSARTPRSRRDYPEWKQVYDVPMILQEIYEANVDKWVRRRRPTDRRLT